MKPKSSYGLIGNTTKTHYQHLNNCCSTTGILYTNTGYTWCHSALFLTESAQPDPSEQVCVMTTAAVDCVAVLKGGKHPPSGAYSQWALKEVCSAFFFFFLQQQTRLRVFLEEPLAVRSCEFINLTSTGFCCGQSTCSHPCWGQNPAVLQDFHGTVGNVILRNSHWILCHNYYIFYNWTFYNFAHLIGTALLHSLITTVQWEHVINSLFAGRAHLGYFIKQPALRCKQPSWKLAWRKEKLWDMQKWLNLDKEHGTLVNDMEKWQTTITTRQHTHGSHWKSDRSGLEVKCDVLMQRHEIN